MIQRATITSKMQLTLPMQIARKIGVKPGQKVNVSEEEGKIIITPIKHLIEELAGSLAMPKNWEGKDIDVIIKEAKAEYFHNKQS